MYLRLRSSLKTPEMSFSCDMVKDIYHVVIVRRINNNAITSGGGGEIPIQSVEKVFPFFFFAIHTAFLLCRFLIQPAVFL